MVPFEICPEGLLAETKQGPLPEPDLPLVTRAPRPEVRVSDVGALLLPWAPCGGLTQALLVHARALSCRLQLLCQESPHCILSLSSLTLENHRIFCPLKAPWRGS